MNEFNFYTTDESFDYGDFTYHQNEYHGFSIDLEDDDPKIETLEGYGDFATEVENIKTLEELETFIKDNLLKYHDSDTGTDYKNFTLLLELIKEKLGEK